MWLLCGLGNPDKKYELTRHNLGFDIIDELKDLYNFVALKKDKKIELYKGKIGLKDCLLCKPLTYMNLSGPPIGKIVNYYKISKSSLIVIHDDLDLAIGKVKIKIDPGTQSGKVLRLKGKGIPNIQGYGTGDFLIYVNVWTPQQVSKEEKAALEKLKASENFKPNPTSKDKGFFDRMKDYFN